uniref:Protein kinase domain-containing protein n=1 Tax=Leersia perrieri TaxID=77586 RepID=A0A0D9VNK4_9ORYZ
MLEMLLQRHRHRLLCCGGGATAPSRFVAGDGEATTDHHKNAVARQLSWAQVEAMTRGFTSSIVGEGGFSTVYLARIAGSLAAVKVHRSSERLHRAFRQELDALLRLHGGSKGVTMTWTRRVAVATQVAKALEYLHDRCDPQVVHGDVKSSNILLDAAMAARLCDFGSAHAGFVSAAVHGGHPRAPRPSALAVLGSPGYVDPHYLRSGVITKKSDVYSFGVLLLELLTGEPAFVDGRLLTAAVAPNLKDDVQKLVDKRLGCRYDVAEAAAVAALAAACVGENPSLRPSMADVVRTLEQHGGKGGR